jgi:RNase P subunit RPR2
VEYEGYCVKCRQKVQVSNGVVGRTAKGRPMVKGTCPKCGTTVTRFISEKQAQAQS